MSPESLHSILKPDPPEPFFRRIRVYRYFWWLCLGVLALDQITKFLVQAFLPFDSFYPHGGAVVIPHFFYLAHVGNTGAAWSLFSGRNVFLAIVALVTLCGIYFWRKSLMLRLLPVQLAFGALCGGILGNLVDRVGWGYVIDFIDLRFGSYIYPTFNIADSGIFVGVVIYLWHSLRR